MFSEVIILLKILMTAPAANAVIESPANICWSSKRLEDVLKTYLEDVFNTSWRQTKCLLGISVSNKSKCVSNKSLFHKSISDKTKANPKCVT